MCMKVRWYILEYFFGSLFFQKFKNFNWYCNSRNFLNKNFTTKIYCKIYDGSFFSFYLDWAKCSEQKTRKGKIRFFMHWVDSYVTQSWNDSKYLNILKALLKLLTALKQRTTWFMRHSVFGYGTVQFYLNQACGFWHKHLFWYLLEGGKNI